MMFWEWKRLCKEWYAPVLLHAPSNSSVFKPFATILLHSFNWSAGNHACMHAAGATGATSYSAILEIAWLCSCACRFQVRILRQLWCFKVPDQLSFSMFKQACFATDTHMSYILKSSHVFFILVNAHNDFYSSQVCRDQFLDFDFDQVLCKCKHPMRESASTTCAAMVNFSNLHIGQSSYFSAFAPRTIFFFEVHSISVFFGLNIELAACGACCHFHKQLPWRHGRYSVTHPHL